MIAATCLGSKRVVSMMGASWLCLSARRRSRRPKGVLKYLRTKEILQRILRASPAGVDRRYGPTVIETPLHTGQLKEDLLLSDVLAGLAVLTGAVAYGAEAFAATVLRPALACADDRTLVTTMGEIHRYGDQRMPFGLVIALIASILSAAAAAVEGRAAAAAAAAAAASWLLLWVLVFLRVSAPINRVFIRAATDGRIPADVRRLQGRWDRVLYVRLCLHTLMLASLCTALALA